MQRNSKVQKHHLFVDFECGQIRQKIVCPSRLTQNGLHLKITDLNDDFKLDAGTLHLVKWSNMVTENVDRFCDPALLEMQHTIGKIEKCR